MLNLIGTAVAFIIVVVLIRKKANFGLSLIIGALVLGGFSLTIIAPVDIVKAIVEASFYSFKNEQFFTSTIELAFLMFLIFTLARLMQQTGAITRLIDSMRTLFSKGGILGIIPAVYGLMPVPGGALFSAPMIDVEGNKYNLKKNHKNFLNVWFRHIWFPIFPVSSAMILICSTDFSNIDIYLLVLANIPSFLIALFIGFIVLKKLLPKKTIEASKEAKDYSGLIYLLPPIIPLICYLFLQIIGFPQIRSFIIGVLLSILSIYVISHMDLLKFKDLLLKSFSWKLPLAIFGIMIFREMFSTTKADIQLAELIGELSIPTLIIIILIPLVLGILTGYNLGAIALSYPLVEPFFMVSGLSILGLTSIIFLSSLAGYLVSPIHLCNVVSSEYLKTDATRMYNLYVPAALTLLVVQVIFAYLIL